MLQDLKRILSDVKREGSSYFAASEPVLRLTSPLAEGADVLSAEPVRGADMSFSALCLSEERNTRKILIARGQCSAIGTYFKKLARYLSLTGPADQNLPEKKRTKPWDVWF